MESIKLMANAKELLDLYTDYIIISASSGQVTSTGLSRLVDDTINHDKVTRLLRSGWVNSKVLLEKAKTLRHEINEYEGILIFDDTIVKKSHTDENAIIGYHYDCCKRQMVKGINLVSGIIYSMKWDMTIPVAVEAVHKGKPAMDKKTGKMKRRNEVSKQQLYKKILHICENNISFRYVVNDSWYASAENMNIIKSKIKKDFVMAIKSNRKVAMSEEDKKNGRYVKVESLLLGHGVKQVVYFQQLDFPVVVVGQVFKNGDDTSTLYLATSDLTLSYEAITTIYHKRWKVEEYHKSLKSNYCIERAPVRTVVTQMSHFIASVLAFIKMEVLKIRHGLNHFAIKSKLYLAALKNAQVVLQKL